jgi:hypothetical protein
VLAILLGGLDDGPAVVEVIAAGTSVAACLPFFIAASITGTCHSHGVAV